MNPGSPRPAREPERVHRVIDPTVEGVIAPEDLERLLDQAHSDGWDLIASIDGVAVAAEQRGQKIVAVRRPLLILRRSPRRSSSFVAGTRSAMGDRLANGATVVDVVRRAAKAFGVHASDVLSRPFKKTRHVTRARQVAAYVLRTTGLSYPEIGTALAHMDHTSAMSACRNVEREPELLAIARSIAPAPVEEEPSRAVEDE